MVKHRDKNVGCNESSDNDDFVKPHNKMKTSKKTGKPKTSKECTETGKNKGNKSDSTKPFRANFGPLYDLFRDLENKGLLLTKEMINLLRRHHFISKDELCKSNHGLEMLIHTFTKTEDGQYGFNLVEGNELFISTPEDMVVDLGLHILENGIENKLINERKVTPSTNDLCIRYKFGETSPPVVMSTEVQVAIVDAIKNGRVEDFVRLVVFYIKGDVKRITGCTFYLMYWFAEHSSLVQRMGGAETIVPRFPRCDAWSISNAISKVMNMEKENIALIMQNEEWINTQRGILGRFRSERDRIVAKSKRLKVDVKREIYKAMEETLDEIFKSLDEKSRDYEQVQEHDDQPQRLEAPQEEYDIGPDEYGRKTPDTETSLSRTKSDVADFSIPEKGSRVKKNNEVHVSSLVRGVKTRSSRPEKGIGEDFTPEGRGNKKESKPVQNYKQFENLKLYKHMKKGDREALQPDFAWRLIDHDGGVSFSVLGAHVQDLVDNVFIEGELLEYYMYKLDLKQKEAESQMQDSQAPGKYAKSVFMKPGALELLQSNDEDGFNEYICDFILRIPDDVTKPFIPIFTKSTSHWTLLHFNFSDHRWKHYNSL
ncbi:hypothetical protein MKX03_024857 [Papaver bracteatum]|nr:hypothetical protein MKX03_024857 [Papaver bracteatum]